MGKTGSCCNVMEVSSFRLIFIVTILATGNQMGIILGGLLFNVRGLQHMKLHMALLSLAHFENTLSKPSSQYVGTWPTCFFVVMIRSRGKLHSLNPWDGDILGVF